MKWLKAIIGIKECEICKQRIKKEDEYWYEGKKVCRHCYYACTIKYYIANKKASHLI